MSKKSHIEHSRFWLGDNFDLDKELGKDDVIGLLRLAAFRRAIGNFVFILTGKSIPVKFFNSSQSKTDGQVIFIGGDLSHGEFDETVGLSLHESMHIVKSDFNLLKNMWGKVPNSIYDIAKNKLSKSAISIFVKHIFNVVEDRYIDAWAYEKAPGYRGYYVALYNRYFNLPKISSALKSKSYREPTLKSYRFRFTNITNPNTDLDALPGLREIYKILDLENILRLNNPTDRMDLAIKISLIIINQIVEEDKKKEQKNNEKNNSTSEEENLNDEKKEEDSDVELSDGDKEDSSPENKGDEKDDFTGDDNVSDEEKQKELEGENLNDKGDLTDKQMEELEKIIKKQSDIINRESTQKAFDDETIKKLDILEKSGIDLIKVGGEQGIPEINCVVVKNMTKELMESEEFPYTTKMKYFYTPSESASGISDGIILGTMLGRRLQIRGESHITRFSRLDKGKFDRRLISDLGFNCNRVFFQTQTDKYKYAHMHISVDASSSMSGKWKRTMTSVVAMAKAASMINNLGVTISFRSGVVIGKKNVFENDEMPYVVIAYDSRIDKFSKITQLFPMLLPNGSTPEGLAFEAIMETIPATTPDLDSYFVNLSDGEPAFSNGYFGVVAQNHTKQQVNKIREAGINVLSYFVEMQYNADERISTNTIAFRNMYGKDAQIIDVNNVTEIALTMNRKFLVNDK